MISIDAEEAFHEAPIYEKDALFFFRNLSIGEYFINLQIIYSKNLPQMSLTGSTFRLVHLKFCTTT